MKKKYLLLFVCFIFIMGALVVFFMYRFNNIGLRNETNHLLKDLYNMDSGAYSLRNGIIYQTDNKMSSKAYFKASGDIEIDKYKNVRLKLNYKDRCISKTYEGNIIISYNDCPSFKAVDVKINRNNNKISFISETKNLEYKISYEDDYVGQWIKEDYKDNIVLKTYQEGTNYIWFKDSDGNLSDVLTFNVDCLYTTRAKYDNNVFYCSGSTVNIDGIDFVVVKDDASVVTLMKFSPINETLSHCVNDNHDYCFYEKSAKNTYNWKNSYVNYYLNNEFIKELSNDTINTLVDTKICIDEGSKCDDELCIGRSREEINRRGFKCNKYTSSKIKLISYDEFNYAYTKTHNKDAFNGYYLSTNSFYKDYGSSIQYDQSFYVYEDLNKKLDIKPVIILSK